MVQPKARHRANDTFFACSGKNYIFDLEKKIGRSANGRGEVSAL